MHSLQKRKQLFLASSGWDTINLFTTLLKVDPRDLRVTFIPTAAYLDLDPWYQRKDREALLSRGFFIHDLELTTATRAQIVDGVGQADVLFVAGGNTFYLLQEMRRTGAGEIIKDAVMKGTWYFGSSAGSVVAGPDISPVRFVDDPAMAKALTSTGGLALTNILVLPHWGIGELREENLRVEKDALYKGISSQRLANNQALLIKGDTVTLLMPQKTG